MNFGQRHGAVVTRFAAMAAMCVAVSAVAQNPGGQQQGFPVPGGGLTSTMQAAPIPQARPATPNGTVVEDALVRINDQVITRTEYERSLQSLTQEAKQENWTPAQFQEKQRDLLRDMIDQQLLLSKGKELGVTGDAEVTRQLDEIRKRANLPDMESLEKAAAQQGVSYEDFKQNIRNQVITQQVVREEVGRRLSGAMTPGQEQIYYQAHAKDFEQPEQVHLSEILVPTPENATDAQIATAQAKADDLYSKLKAGGSFADLAKSGSGGPTASAGGDLGDFKRGMLGDVLENATFPLPVGGYTSPIRTRQGFVILKVDSHQAAGTPPMNQVEGQVQEALYMSLLQPALRKYLTEARRDAYVKITPGFVDSGAGGADSNTTFTAYAPPPVKKKVIKHQRAEQQKAEKAEQQLAAAREKLAQKQQNRAAAAGGVQNVSAPRKQKKIKREKVRFGQAPRNALPNGSPEITAAVPSLGAAPGGSTDATQSQAAPGTAVASVNQTLTSITTGTAAETEDPLTQQAAPERKTRFSARESETDEKKAQSKLVKAEAKTSKRPEPATQTQTADEKVQAAPLGQVGPVQKPKKPKRKKGDPKERLQDKPKPAETIPEVAPTVNPALGTSAAGTSTNRGSGATSDRTTLPSANAPAPGTLPQSNANPSTGAQPNTPTPANPTTPQPQ